MEKTQAISIVALIQSDVAYICIQMHARRGTYQHTSSHTNTHNPPTHTHTKGHSHCGTLDLIGLSWTQSLRHTASRKWLLRYSDTRGCNSGTWPWISFFRPLNQDTFYPLVFALAAPVKLIFFSVPFLNHPHPVWLRSKRFKQGPI